MNAAGNDRAPGPVQHAVSFVVHRPARPDQVLTVRRPADDRELPNVWGLPAGALRPGESWTDAVRRAGREKLGVELEVGRELNHGTTPREGYTLEMKLFQARIVAGEPHVPQPHTHVTQYTDWRWDRPGTLAPAAARGSLCSRLFLEHDGSSHT